MEYDEDELAHTPVLPEMDGAGDGLKWKVVVPAGLVQPLIVAVTE